MQAIKTKKLDVPMPPSDALWQREDLLLVAAGSGPCLRELYYRALAQNKLHQLQLCFTSAADYTMGNAEDKIMQGLRKATAVPGVQIVVLYLNCLDILTRLDFEHIEKSLTQETGVLVRCFFRGPLGKMDIAHFVPVQTFLAQLPKPKGKIINRSCPLPPMLTDIAGVMDCFNADGNADVLVAPSGCQACLRDCDLLDSREGKYYLDCKKQDFVFGLEDSCLEQCRELAEMNDLTSINLISSAVAAFIGFDGDWVARSMNSMLKIRNFALDGFHDAVYGASCAQKLLVQEESVRYEKSAKDVLILGYSPLLCGAREQYASCISYIKELGYRPRFIGEEGEGRPALCWVVSTAGIEAAEALYNDYEIPMLISCPVGEHALRMWKKHVRELCENGKKEKRQLCIHNFTLQETDTRRILLIGDPIHTMGLAHSLWHKGFQHVRLAALCMHSKSRRLYRQTPGADRWLVFADSLTSLQDLWEDADVVIADRQLVNAVLAAGAPEKIVLEFPWGIISGRSACTGGSGALGTDIAARLELLLN